MNYFYIKIKVILWKIKREEVLGGMILSWILKKNKKEKKYWRKEKGVIVYISRQGTEVSCAKGHYK